MLAVSLPSTIVQSDRTEVDQVAHKLVCSAYRNAAASAENPHAKFDAALEMYMKTYPHIAKEVARHAVAYILSTDGL
jgi:hypothetical protein